MVACIAHNLSHKHDGTVMAKHATSIHGRTHPATHTYRYTEADTPKWLAQPVMTTETTPFSTTVMDVDAAECGICTSNLEAPWVAADGFKSVWSPKSSSLSTIVVQHVVNPQLWGPLWPYYRFDGRPPGDCCRSWVDPSSCHAAARCHTVPRLHR